LLDESQDQISEIHKSEQQLQDRILSLESNLEEQIRQVKKASDNSTNEILSKQHFFEALLEETSKKCNQRLQRLEEECITGIQKRLDGMDRFSENRKESSMNDESSTNDESSMNEDVMAKLTGYESRLGEVTDKVEQAMQVSYDLCARTSTIEHHVKTLRTLLDTRDEQSHWVYDRLEKVARGTLETLGEISDARHGIIPSGAAFALDTRIKQCLTEVEECKSRIAQLSSGMKASHVDSDLAKHLSTLVQELQDLKPKFNQHETDIRDLYAKFGKQSKKIAFELQEMCAKHDEQVNRLAYVLERGNHMENELCTGERRGCAENATEEELQNFIQSVTTERERLMEFHKP